MGAGGGGRPGNCFNSTTILNENETKQIFKKLLLFTWMGTKTKQNQILWRYTQNSSFQKKTKMMHVSKMHKSFFKNISKVSRQVWRVKSCDSSPAPFVWSPFEMNVTRRQYTKTLQKICRSFQMSKVDLTRGALQALSQKKPTRYVHCVIFQNISPSFPFLTQLLKIFRIPRWTKTNVCVHWAAVSLAAI